MDSARPWYAAVPFLWGPLTIYDRHSRLSTALGDLYARGSQGCSALDVSKVLVHGWILAAFILGIVWVRTVHLAGVAATHPWPGCPCVCLETLSCIVRMQIFASGDLVVSHVRRPPDAPLLASTKADLAHPL